MFWLFYRKTTSADFLDTVNQRDTNSFHVYK